MVDLGELLGGDRNETEEQMYKVIEFEQEIANVRVTLVQYPVVSGSLSINTNTNIAKITRITGVPSQMDARSSRVLL